ncbi:MAG: hypothetical protein HYY97_12980 [Rhodocyclales bacterium]|nr:hypothetical protein [Rhodocyclales bacterium]
MADQSPWVSKLDLSTKAIGLVASCCLAASLIYDWGFYLALDLSFLEIPSVLSDHVRSALLWFPKLAVSLGALLVHELFIQRMEKGMTEEEIIASSQNPERTRRFRDGPQKVIALLAVLGVIGYIIAGDIFLGILPLGLCIAWVSFSVWAQSPERLRIRRPIAIRLAIHLLPPISIWMFFTGYNDAIRLYQPRAGESHITIKNNPKPLAVVLLRQLDKGLLLKEDNGAIGFRPWSEIERIETPGKYKPNRGIVCSWLNVGCLQDIGPTKSVSSNEKSNPAVNTDAAR